MMKLVVLAMALTAASAGTTLLPGLPLVSGGIPYAGGAVPFGTHIAPSPLTYSAVHPVGYGTVAAAPLVAPSPYAVHTGARTEITYEPVEQHGYVVKY